MKNARLLPMPAGMMNIAVCVLLVSLLACNEPFDPRAPLDEQMVVFSILSTDREVQYVRVQQSYMSPAFDATSFISDNSVTDAIVSIRATSGVYILRDTLLARLDTSRYKFPLRAYVLNPFTPQRGRSYRVIVQSSYYGLASASVIVPDQSKISFSSATGQVLDRPERYSQDTPIIFVVQLSRNARGYVGRLLLYYDVLKGSEWIEERAEIPVLSADSSSYSLDVPRYPQLAVTPSMSQIGLMYRNGYYRAILNKLNFQYRSNRIIFKWATLVLLQADQGLYEYFAATHASQDPWSIRLDEPMVSKVSGGLGVVGAYSLDSLVNILPENFYGNR